jgi:hypothetical protein
MADTILTTVARVTTFKTLGTDPVTIARLTGCIAAASAYMERRIGRPLGIATYMHRLSGNGTPALRLPAYPVTAVASVVVCGQPWVVMLDTDAELGQDCILDDAGRMLLARSWPWPRGIGNIQVTYTAGLGTYTPPSAGPPIVAEASTFPDDIQHATVLVTHLLMIETDRIGEGALTLGPEQVQNLARDPKDYDFIEKTIAYWRGF